MITVKIIYKDGTDTIKDCFSVEDISLVNVLDIKVIRSK